jgi:Ca2+-transporting ATPase
MGPTCSIIYENEPMEKNTMAQKPRPFTATFFNWHELTTSIVQGLAITAGTLFAYQYAVGQGFSESRTRAMVFTVLIAANIFLTLVNRSFFYSILTTIRYKNNLVPLMIGATLLIIWSLLYIQPLARFFDFEALSTYQLTVCGSIGFASVIWYEGVKWWSRRKALNVG